MEEFKSLSKENNKLEEKPDANNTPASLEEAQSNALMALADTAASLSRAVNKIAAYVPTQWVDNSEPSINANNLMHIENGIRDATAAVNNAIDAITEINGKIGNIQNSGIVNDMDNAISNRIEFMGYDRNTLNSPQKQGISGSGDGVALSYDSGLYGVQFGIARADSYPLIRIRENGSWKPWKNIALKSDLTGVLKYNGTFSGDFNNIDISPGIYKINTKYTNAPSQLPVYCVFIQFPVYNLQMIITGDQMFTRKYTGNPAYWTPWRWYSYDGND